MTDHYLDKRIELARKDLQAILKQIDNIGSTAKAFKFWNAYLQLRGLPKFQINRKVVWALIAFGWIFYYFIVNYIDSLQYQKCLIDSPDIFRKIFRPAEDCSMCLGVQQVEKISNIDPDVFEERYAYSGMPVVITDATKNWTASKVFSFQFFKALYQGRDGDCQFFPYQTGFKSLQDVFNMSQNRAMLKADTEAWYVGWSNCDEEIGAILRDHYDRPYFLPATAESEKTDWIFMGSPGYGAPMHIDDVNHPSWQAQIKGSKLWVLEPPKECHYVCNRLSIIVNEGEIIILDTNRWYHQTKIISENLSITIGAEYD
ncbi:uncharacterized protein [Chelonus insularis]|uniref:uncharacterized protein n=1 Tax=Chelonus insularis TaxID=460826 RepID=UPI00158A6A4F|nr:uncharacterized protein LOC118069507 [Chelonus insularis]